MTEERRGGIADGIRTGIGVLAAFKEAIEETFEEAVARGDLSPERARSAVRDATERMQASLAEARERIDVVSRREFESLRGEVEELRRRLERYEAGGSDSEAADEGSFDGIPID